MKQPWMNNIVPVQHTGKQTNAATSRHFNNEPDAAQGYQVARERLLNINSWHRYAGKGTAEFQLVDAQANPVYRPALKGDYFRINIPGPGSKAGGGDDWVEIRALGSEKERENEITFFTVRAAPHPLNLGGETAHFFDQTATSTFVVMKEKQTVTAAVYGRNEKANVSNRHLLDALRNALTAFGAWIGLSEVQWKALTQGLVADNDSSS
jgi:hypothetical protein